MPIPGALRLPSIEVPRPTPPIIGAPTIAPVEVLADPRIGRPNNVRPLRRHGRIWASAVSGARVITPTANNRAIVMRRMNTSSLGAGGHQPATPRRCALSCEKPDAALLPAGVHRETSRLPIQWLVGLLVWRKRLRRGGACARTDSARRARAGGAARVHRATRARADIGACADVGARNSGADAHVRARADTNVSAWNARADAHVRAHAACRHRAIARAISADADVGA